MTDRQQFVKAILDLRYGTLREIAEGLADMIDGDVRPKVTTGQEFAELLFDWAEAQDGDPA